MSGMNKPTKVGVREKLLSLGLSGLISISDPHHQPHKKPIQPVCAEAEAPILWPPDVKSRLVGKEPDAWKD